jgi:RimK family alpha-L-glutamate ligase
MKIAILHQDLEYQEKVIKEKLEEEGFPTDLIDVRKTTSKELSNYSLILNRVFASVANRNYEDNLRTLDLLKKTTTKSINSYFTSKCDYSKYFASTVLDEKEIRNPKTTLLKSAKEIKQGLLFAKKCGYPIVLKRDIGGRAKEIFLIENESKLESKLNYLFQSSNEYKGGYILQKKINSIYDHDYRVGVINGKIIFCNTRSIVADEEGKKWITSASNGSIVLNIKTPPEIGKIAIESSKAIQATMNEVDIIVDENGPVIIENNPTPNYTITSEIRRKMLDLTIDKIKNLLLKEDYK